MPRRISILGSTGSIGRNALNVIDNLEGEFEVVYLTAHQNSDRLIEQALHYKPKAVAIIDQGKSKLVEEALKTEQIEVLIGRSGLLEIAGRENVDIVLNALVGSAGMEPTILAVQAGIDVALSNKESLVMAGEIINRAMEKSGAKIFPVDSEHSAIWQCLQGENFSDVKKIILTGSGGPFRTRAVNTFKSITPKEALQHPNWDMGSKITIDSATMMNKGLEVIEAYWLFQIDPANIEIVIHPQSIVHSMVEFQDGSVKAQMGLADMKIPIQYALTYPRHIATNWESLNLPKLNTLTFEEPDFVRFPSIQLAFQSLKSLGTAPAVLNVANEQAVHKFLKGDILFTEIPEIVASACSDHEWKQHPTLKELIELEKWTVSYVDSY
ncbi:1-deoxy-D-xylulose-5-phosphate reductoisomerase [Candidatus Neomarinimicrobiota bacterium]